MKNNKDLVIVSKYMIKGMPDGMEETNRISSELYRNENNSWLVREYNFFNGTYRYFEVSEERDYNELSEETFNNIVYNISTLPVLTNTKWFVDYSTDVTFIAEEILNIDFRNISCTVMANKNRFRERGYIRSIGNLVAEKLDVDKNSYCDSILDDLIKNKIEIVKVI